MTHKTKLILLLSAVSLGACATDTAAPSYTFGSAIKHNVAVQTVAPTDEQKQNTYIRPNAERMAAARERYKKDEVEEPADLSTID